MDANKIIILREIKIFCRAFLLNFLVMLLASAMGISNPLPFLILISAIYFAKINNISVNSLFASVLFMELVIPFFWQEHPLAAIVDIILIFLLLKQYALRECAWASWTFGSKLAFCLYVDGFDYLIFISFLWFMLASQKEMKINTNSRPPFDIIPK